MRKLLYWSYGSNLNIAQMKRRCPDAEPIAAMNLPNAVLRFRGVADVAYLRGGVCPGGIWEVSRSDVVALDRYESVSSGLYARVRIKVLYRGEERSCLLYQMNSIGITGPTQSYLDVIAQGYRDFGLDLDRLRRALEHSFWRERKTAATKKWRKRKGWPQKAIPIGNPALEEVGSP